MIDEASIQLIRQTASTIKARNRVINQQVYANLASHYPAAHALLLQAGSPPLAGIVANYAASIDNLAPFLQYAPKIARVHQRIDLQEAHFEMLGNALFDAFQQALGDALSVAALQAWRRAYDDLAAILIRLQRELPSAQPAPLMSEQ